MRVRLWSWNYTPEPTGMAPVAAAWSRAMAIRGHQVDVISAFPHYPSTLFRQRARPYRETIDGITVTRLPLVIGHATPAQRMLEETTYALSAAVASFRCAEWTSRSSSLRPSSRLRWQRPSAVCAASRGCFGSRICCRTPPRRRVWCATGDCSSSRGVSSAPPTAVRVQSS